MFQAFGTGLNARGLVQVGKGTMARRAVTIATLALPLSLLLQGVVLPNLLVQECHAATDQERAGARSAASEGIQAFQDGQTEKALKLLEQAESIVHAPTHLLFIALSRAKLGKLVEAREAYIN